MCTPTVASWIFGDRAHYHWYICHSLTRWEFSPKTKNGKRKSFRVSRFYFPRGVLICCQMGQATEEETQSLGTICAMRQAKKIYRWKTFIVSVVQLEPGKEKQDKITATIWAALLFFCCCVNWGSNLRLFVPSQMKTKAATGIHTKYIKNIIGQKMLRSAVTLSRFFKFDFQQKHIFIHCQ